MSVPKEVRDRIKSRLWGIAEKLDWSDLSLSEKRKFYEQWTVSPEIGEVLSTYLDKGSVRVYIKDTLLKGYSRNALAAHSDVFRQLGIGSESPCTKKFIKPHGRILADGRLVTWGRAEDWKMVLMATYERAFWLSGNVPSTVLLAKANVGRYGCSEVRKMVEAAALRLGIGAIVWRDL